MTHRREPKKIAEGPCFRCRGDGYYWRVPDGFNPFYAGAVMTAQVSEKVRCWRCQGTGRALRVVGDANGETPQGGTDEQSDPIIDRYGMAVRADAAR